MTEKFRIICTTQKGLENLLAQELENLGAENITLGRRMVECVGDQRLLYKANFHLRTALKVLKPIYTCTAKDPEELYEQLKKVEWEKYLSLKKTFSIDSIVFSETMRHQMYVTYRTKDAIMDYFMEKEGKRMRVSTENPDIPILVHVSHDTCTVSLNSSGESLHKRGYRTEQTEAPINEVLAAGILMMAGWKGETDFIDPMCGSGTFLIEAGLIALGIPPGIYRKSFAFEKWKDFDADLLEEIAEDDSGDKEFKFKLYGSDISGKAINITQANVDRAGLSKYVNLEDKRFETIDAPAGKGLLVTNPPYGERLQLNDLSALYERIGQQLKHHFKGWDAWIISEKGDLFNYIGLKPAQKVDLLNGQLPCELRYYQLFEGKRKEHLEKANRYGRQGKKQSPPHP
ncbi:MAG: THUMP domain-containing protein [Bacteroidales bacterium]|nr:THUMP domain-containing protein [Bacteroidales bacterium]